MRLGKKHFCAFLLMAILPFSELSASEQLPTIAIIIDDMGHNYRTGYELAHLPYPITLVFPYLAVVSRKSLAELAVWRKTKKLCFTSQWKTLSGFHLGNGCPDSKA